MACHRELLQKIFIFVSPVLVGIYLLCGQIRENSATYDEVVYTEIACRWWLTGDSTKITRMGSPVTFWRVQTAPALFLLDNVYDAHDRLENPVENIPNLLPWFRLSAVWVWLAGLAATQAWAWRNHGRSAAFFGGLLYALSPNLLAHGSLLTMETPLWTFWTLTFFALAEFLKSRSMKFLVLAGVFAGLSFSMKFTAVLLPPICFVIFFLFPGNAPQTLSRRVVRTIGLAVLFGIVMILSDLVVTGFDRMTLSEQTGTHPFLESRFPPRLVHILGRVLEAEWPVDWVGFLTQLRFQRAGGPSYLLGEISSQGWPWYYLVTLVTKVPVVILVAFLIRSGYVLNRWRKRQLELQSSEVVIAAVITIFIIIACIASKRNYGLRYLLPLAPMAIVMMAGIVRQPFGRSVATAVTALLAITVVRAHPYELTYFNALVGGPEQGRYILADSNLDWGQGLIQLRQMQDAQPDLKDISLFYFGDLSPAIYGIKGRNYQVDALGKYPHLPENVTLVNSKYVAVSTSLINGPWGPPGYFQRYSDKRPTAATPDFSIQIFQTIVE